MPHLSFLSQGNPHLTSSNQQGWFLSFLLPQMQDFSTKKAQSGQSASSKWH